MGGAKSSCPRCCQHEDGGGRDDHVVTDVPVMMDPINTPARGETTNTGIVKADILGRREDDPIDCEEGTLKENHAVRMTIEDPI